MLEERAGLRGKIAYVIGGGAGIGHAVSMALAKAGVDLAICDKNAQALKDTAGAVRDLGRRVFVQEADVLDAGAIDAFYTAALAQFPRINVLVNLAGGTRQRDFLTGTDAQDAEDIRRNFGYVIQSIRAAVPHMPRGGSVINFTTIEAHRGAATFSVYAGAKAATCNLTRALAVEFGPRGIRFNEVAPDTTPTQGNAEALRPDLLAMANDAGAEVGAHAMRLYVPLGEPPTPDHIADTVLFLASNLSAMVSGVTMHVDGGTSAAMGFLDWPFGVGPIPTAVGPAATALFRGNPYPDG